MAEATRIIYCAGNQGRVVLDILRRGGSDDDVVFVDDDRESGAVVDGTEVVGGREQLSEFDPDSTRCIVAFGDRRAVRLELVARVQDHGLGFFSAIDPETTISPLAAVADEGVMLNARTYVGPGARIEPHALVDSCVNISHDAHVKRGATLAPNVTLAGETTVGEDAYLGAGAVVINQVSVGPGALVGAGAVVTEDVPADTTVVGIPAEELSR